MAGNALRQWLNPTADDKENKKSLDTFHEQVMKDIPIIASKSEDRLLRLLPDEGDAPLAGQLIWANLDRQPGFEVFSYIDLVGDGSPRIKTRLVLTEGVFLKQLVPER